MTLEYAKAYPRKHFFLEMFTRDISLEGCILDLIDNSIDGLVRTKNIDFVDSVFDTSTHLTKENKNALPIIALSFSAKGFAIVDACGGIPEKDAIEDVFNFGHDKAHSGESSKRQLGAYGIGLKRALFKIGKNFEIKSKTVDDGFAAKLNIDEWAQNDKSMNDWRIPIRHTSAAKSDKTAGTKIMIRNLRDDVKMVLSDTNFESRLYKAIAQTYAMFLEKYVRVKLRGKIIEPMEIPIGESKDVAMAHEKFQEDGVKIKIFASLAARGSQKEWRTETAGWYVMCNGRVVVAADKTELTGWGAGLLPSFHVKQRGFVGMVFFQSSNPLSLPWDTTKRGLYRESPLFQKVRNRMSSVARPIISFLDSMYKGDTPEEPAQRDIAERVQQADIRVTAAKPSAVFEVEVKSQSAPKEQRVQYFAKIEDLELIRKHLKRPKMSLSGIGLHTMGYFLKAEGLR